MEVLMPNHNDIEKILVIQTAFIGDAILTLPMLQELRRKNPDAQIDIIAIPSTKEIFEASAAVTSVIVLDKRGSHKSIYQFILFCKEIRKKNYTKIYSPHRSFRSAFIVMQSGVRETYGFSSASLKFVYKNIVEYQLNQHEVKRNLMLAGFDVSGDNWKIFPSLKANNDDKLIAEQFFAGLNKKALFAAVAPNSIWGTKIYPKEFYIEIIKYLISESFHVLLIGGDRDTKLCDEIAKEFNGSVSSAAGKFSILQSIEILRRTSILISNDSSPTHMGMCADIPVLTIFCSTSPLFGFYPYNEKSDFVSYDDLSCKPCGIHGYSQCPLDHFNCANKLKPDKIIEKLRSMLV